jgi:polyisoprenoid-binding protein YceI
MKKLLFCLTLALTFASQSAFAQIYKNKDKGVKIAFFSETPMENISAESSAGTSMWAFSNDSIAFKVAITTFRFPNSLMEEHFNENYMESEKYPNATFKGKVSPHIDVTKAGTYKVSATGWLDIHGVKQLRTIEGTLIVNADGTLNLKSTFDVKLADHKITVPSIVGSKIAETIQVKLNVDYVKR